MARRKPFQSIFDLGHLADLSGAPALVLVISERTSYLLHNLAACDLFNPHRYAVEVGPDEFFQAVDEVSNPTEWVLFRDVAENAQTQVLEVGHMPLYGYQSVIAVNQVFVGGASPYLVDLYVVPANTMVEAQLIRAYNATQTLSALNVYLRNGAVYHLLMTVSNLAVGQNVIWTGKAALEAGQAISLLFVGGQINDNLVGQAWLAELVQ